MKIEVIRNPSLNFYILYNEKIESKFILLSTMNSIETRYKKKKIINCIIRRFELNKI